MGLLPYTADRLCRHAKTTGWKDAACVLLGRQDVFFSFDRLADMLARHGLPAGPDIRTWGPTQACREAIVQAVAAGQHVNPRNPELPSQEILFHAIGFARVDSVDVHGGEGATIIFDLNETPAPHHDIWRHKETYDLVIDGGTGEHVFNFVNVLKTMFFLAAPDGFLMHSTPANGMVDHGFYQVSPTLFQDFYEANGHDVLEVCLVRVPTGTPWTEHLDIPYEPGALDGRAILEQSGYSFIVEAIARKRPGSSCDRNPIQGYYRRKYRMT